VSYAVGSRPWPPTALDTLRSLPARWRLRGWPHNQGSSRVGPASTPACPRDHWPPPSVDDGSAPPLATCQPLEEIRDSSLSRDPSLNFSLRNRQDTCCEGSTIVPLEGSGRFELPLRLQRFPGDTDSSCAAAPAESATRGVWSGLLSEPANSFTGHTLSKTHPSLFRASRGEILSMVHFVREAVCIIAHRSLIDCSSPARYLIGLSDTSCWLPCLGYSTKSTQILP